MIFFLIDNLEYLFWINCLIVISFMIAKRVLIFQYLKNFKNKLKNKEGIIIITKILIIFIPLFADFLSDGFLSRWVEKSTYLLMCFMFYIFIFCYIIFNLRKKIPFKKELQYKFPKVKNLFNYSLSYVLTIMIVYPIFVDLYVKQQPNIFFKITSNNAKNFFVDSTKMSLNFDCNMEILNSSKETYEVYVITSYSTFISEIFNFEFNDSLKYSYPCGNTVSYTGVAFPNNVTFLPLLNKEVFLPNLYNFPVNLNSSNIVSKNNLYEECKTIGPQAISFIDEGVLIIGDYKSKSFSPPFPNVLEFPLYWKSKVIFESNGKKKYTFIFGGYLSHRPSVLDNSRNAFAMVGNFNEAIVMSRNFQFYESNKMLDSKIYSIVYTKPFENFFSENVNLMENRMGGSDVKNNRIMINNSSDEIFWNANTSFFKRNKNDDFNYFLTDQFDKYMSDTTKFIEIEGRVPFKWRQ